jgi:CHC2 zinc finger
MFRRELLPDPTLFWEREIGRLTRPNRKGWALGRCPLHKSKSGRSFAVNLTGGWTCFAGCGKGDQIAFVMRRHGIDFNGAVKYLGADDHERGRKPIHTVPRRVLVMDYAIDGTSYRSEVNDEPKDDLERMRWIHAEAADRLKEIREGEKEIYEGEAETQWAILSLSWQLIQLEVGR